MRITEEKTEKIDFFKLKHYHIVTDSVSVWLSCCIRLVSLEDKHLAIHLVANSEREGDR